MLFDASTLVIWRVFLLHLAERAGRSDDSFRELENRLLPLVASPPANAWDSQLEPWRHNYEIHEETILRGVFPATRVIANPFCVPARRSVQRTTRLRLPVRWQTSPERDDDKLPFARRRTGRFYASLTNASADQTEKLPVYI